MQRKHIAGFGAALLMLSVSPAALAATDEEFLKAAIGINLAEIEAGEMAREKGQSDGVREFGATLIDDHMKANEEANRLATAAGITAPSEPSEEAQREAERLAGLSGVAFDREFATHMAAGHREAIALFEDKADDADNEVSAFAQNTLPDLREHLQTAESLMQEDGIASAAGSMSPDHAMSGAGTGTRPMEGAETGSRPMEGAEPENSYPMAGAAPSAGASNSTDKTGTAASPMAPTAGAAGGMAQNQPSEGVTASPPAGTTARPEGLRSVDLASIGSDALIGATVYSGNDEEVGEVSELLLSTAGAGGEVDAVVIDVGGFLGIGAKPVAIDFENLQIMVDADGNYSVYSRFSREQLEAATAYDASTFQENRERMILRSSP